MIPIIPIEAMVTPTSARPRVSPGQKVDLAELRQKLALAGAKPSYRNLDIVERYNNRIHNRTSAIRAKCIDCSCGMIAEVTRCEVHHCALHSFRLGKDIFRTARAAGEGKPQVKSYSANETVARYAERIRNRGTGIRAKCIECQNGQTSMVAACEAVKCALHPFRLGKDPFRSAGAADSTAESEAEGAEAEDDEDDDIAE